MQPLLSRWLMFGLLIGWALSHANVFAQPAEQGGAKKAAALSTADKLRQGLDKTVNLDFTGQSINDALNHFRDKTGITISVDQVAFQNVGMAPDTPIGQVELKAKDQKAGAALRKLLNAYRLSYIIFEDSVLITTEEMALARQFRQRVSVNLEEVPLKKAVRDLARNQGINLVIDPSVSKQVETPVTLQVDNTGIETAMRLLAELGSVKAVRMGNVMFITTAAKAKSIRDEEAHQLDQPGNPNLPIGMPPMGGFGGGGIGGIAFPGRVVPANPGGLPFAVPGNIPVQAPPPAGVDLPKPIPDAPPPPPARRINPDGTTSSPPMPPRPGVGRPPVAPPIPQRDPNER